MTHLTSPSFFSFCSLFSKNSFSLSICVAAAAERGLTHTERQTQKRTENEARVCFQSIRFHTAGNTPVCSTETIPDDAVRFSISRFVNVCLSSLFSSSLCVPKTQQWISSPVWPLQSFSAEGGEEGSVSLFLWTECVQSAKTISPSALSLMHDGSSFSFLSVPAADCASQTLPSSSRVC